MTSDNCVHSNHRGSKDYLCEICPCKVSAVDIPVKCTPRACPLPYDFRQLSTALRVWPLCHELYVHFQLLVTGRSSFVAAAYALTVGGSTSLLWTPSYAEPSQQRLIQSVYVLLRRLTACRYNQPLSLRLDKPQIGSGGGCHLSTCCQ